ncbi:MAG: S41 family peptidase [Rhodospirillales bacterium]|nr:S41 family peptidase [Rhodospirillales bacterium]
MDVRLPPDDKDAKAQPAPAPAPRGTARRYRVGLLLGTAFLAGAVLGPASGIVARAWHLGVPAAHASDPAQADTYRLLTLFGKVFELTRSKYVDPVPDKKLIENALNGMLTGLDPHSAYMNAKEWADMQVQTRGEFGGLGLEVTEDNGFIRVVSPIDDTPAAKAGVKPGDLITAIDGKTVEGLSLNDAVDRMRGPPNSRISITLKRQGVDKPITLSMLREIIKIKVVKDRMEPNDIGYIRLSQFTERADSGVRDAIAQLKTESHGKLRALILDLRNNPGGLVDQAVGVASAFIDKGEIVSTRGRHADDTQRWNAQGNDVAHGLPLVVLINGGSASASEIVSGALQDHRRAILLGTRSFGKGSVQTIIPLPGEGAVRLTTARYYTPSGRSIQGLGITPDVKVAESREPVEHFLPEREADLNNTIKNEGGTPVAALPPRTDLPAIVKEIPAKPPVGFPAFDPKKGDATDFQLQQALVLANAMAHGPALPATPAVAAKPEVKAAAPATPAKP